MTDISYFLSCYVPYLCSAVAALVAYGLSGGGSLMRFLMTLIAGIGGAIGFAFIASVWAAPSQAVMGSCTPLTLGASMLGTIVAIGAFYDLRRFCNRDRSPGSFEKFVSKPRLDNITDR